MMRVDAYNKISQLYQTNATKKVSPVSGVSATDKVEISRVGRDYQVAKAAVQNSSDVRADKVNDIKNRMEAGTYDISANEVANKIVDSFYDTII
jgi:negative regulator of flagellin synthesis FlgM